MAPGTDLPEAPLCGADDCNPDAFSHKTGLLWGSPFCVPTNIPERSWRGGGRAARTPGEGEGRIQTGGSVLWGPCLLEVPVQVPMEQSCMQAPRKSASVATRRQSRGCVPT